MITVRKYIDEDRKMWDDLCNKSRSPMFMFERGYVEYHSDRFEDHSLLFFDDDELIAIMPASLEADTLYSHGGLTYGGIISLPTVKQVKMMACVEVLIEYAKNHDIKVIYYKFIPHVYHMVPNEDDIYALSRQNYEVVKIEVSTVIDLKNPQKMPKGRKSQISRAKRENVEIKECSSYDEFNAFLKLENEVLRSKHNVSAVHNTDELMLLKSRFPNNIHLFSGYIDDELVCATLVYEYENVIHTQYMASSDKGREVGALDYCVKYVMDKYSQEKSWLDFGISTEDGGNILNEGLVQQKEGFGGRTNIYMTWKIKVS